MALQFEARKVALKQDRTGFILTLSLHPDAHPLGRRDRAGGGQAGQLGRPGYALTPLLLPLLQEASGGSGSGGGGGRALTSVSAPGADRAGAVGVRPAGGPPEWSASR